MRLLRKVDSGVPRPRARKGFTLIELLVVIAIIALLAAILFPVFGQAREKARSSSCASNLKQIGIGIHMYTQDYDETYPPAYYYRKCPGGADSDGIEQWTGFIQSYIKNTQVFVCPSDKIGGQVRTTYASTDDIPQGAVSGGAASPDNQVPHLSYTANEVVMPRPRGGICNNAAGQTQQQVVKLAGIDSVASLITVTEFTDYLNAVSGGGTGGVAFKSHRPFDAFGATAGAGVTSGAYDVGSNMSTVYAISPSAGGSIFNAQPTIAFGDTTTPHIMYVNSGRHQGRNNCLFADGHVKNINMTSALNPKAFLFGTKAYNQVPVVDVLDPATGLPVTAP